MALHTRPVVYYAHCMAYYDTPIEKEDHITLSRMGFDVWCPNRPEVQKAVADARAAGRSGMNLFKDYVLGCDVFAFRAINGREMPAGVQKELDWAKEAGMPIIELPWYTKDVLTPDQTRAFIRAYKCSC